MTHGTFELITVYVNWLWYIWIDYGICKL